MKLRKGLAAAFVVALGLAACSSGDDGSTGGEISADTEGTLKVWLMDGTKEELIDTVNANFNEAYPNVDVQVEIQQWSGIQDKLTTSLGTDSTPDVAEIGNTYTAKYADAGLLAELEPQDFEVDAMLPGLQASGELDGTRYGIPYYGGVRIVAYKKSDFAEANVEVPTSLAELEQVAAKLQAANASNPKYSAWYFPGKFWYGALPFIWDAGGELAEQSGSEWTGTLDSAESQAGLATLKNLVDKYSKAPKDGDETKNDAAFNTGDVGMMMDMMWNVDALTKEGAPFANDVGAFALPGTEAGTTSPAFFGGSDLAVSQKSANQALAKEWVKVMTGTEIQTEMAKLTGYIPNQDAAFAGHEGNEILGVADEASTNSRFTPVSPNWANVESSAVMQDMLVKIFTGQATIEGATTEASQAITDTLND